MNTYNIQFQIFQRQLSASTDFVKQITQPFSKIGVIDFIYLRIYRDSSFIDLSTNAAWSDFFFKKFYQLEYLNHSSILAKNLITLEKDTVFNLWSMDLENPMWLEAKEYFGLGNGITVEKANKNFKEQYYFVAHKNNFKINNFYLNNLDMLEKAILYFKNKADKLIKKSELEKLYFPKEYYISSTHNEGSVLLEDYFLSSIQPSRYHLTYEGEEIIVSSREIACIKLVTQGWNAHEIGRILRISSRTVEAHINNVKLKLHCCKLGEVIYVLAKQKII